MNNSKIEQITLSIRKIKQMRREKSPFSERTFLVFQCIKKKNKKVGLVLQLKATKGVK